MKTVENKLSVASTSALVLSVVRGLYTDGGAKEYLSHLDFSAVEKLAEELTTVTPLFKNMMLLRKKMVRYLIRQLMQHHPQQQVIVLAAGLDPLGLQVAEFFPDKITNIYEVDSAHMYEKQELYAGTGFYDNRLHLLHGDITHIHLLMQTLKEAGYDPQQPTIIVFEGITYYISEEQLMSIMRCFCSRLRSNAVIMDYGIPMEEMTPAFASRASAMAEIFESKVGSTVAYSQKKMKNLLSLLEAEIVELYDMQAMEYLMDGANRMFRGRGEGLLEIAAFHI